MKDAPTKLKLVNDGIAAFNGKPLAECADYFGVKVSYLQSLINILGGDAIRIKKATIRIDMEAWEEIRQVPLDPEIGAQNSINANDTIAKRRRKEDDTNFGTIRVHPEPGTGAHDGRHTLYVYSQADRATLQEDRELLNHLHKHGGSMGAERVG